MTSIARTLSVCLLCILWNARSFAAEAIDLSSYRCSDFLADSTNKTDGSKILRALMMISWGTGYASAHQAGTPRADRGAVDLIAGILGNECRKDTSKTVVEVVVNVVRNFAQSSATNMTSSSAGRQTDSRSRWKQGESIVSLVADGVKRSFIYDEPQPDLASIGVQKGTALFDGKKQGNAYSGTAFKFARLCQPKGYQVTGTISEDEKQVTLHGKAPQIGAGCKVVGSREETLVLTFIPNGGQK